MKTQKTLKYLSLIAVLSIVAAGNMFAATYTWTGGGSTSNWNDAGNWGGTAPVTGQSVGFAGTTNLNVNNNESTGSYSPAGISFAAGSGAFTITGNALKIKGGIGDSATGVNILVNTGGGSNNQLTATGVTTISASTSATLTIDGNWQYNGTSLTQLALNGGGTINLNWSAGSGLTAPMAISGNTTVTLGSVNALGSSSASFSSVGVASGSALQLQGNIALAAPSTQTLTLLSTGVGSKGALENVSSNNSYAGLISVGAGGASIGSDAGNLTLTGGVVNNGNLLTVVGAGNTTFSTAPILGTGGVTYSGTGTLALSGTNGYSGVTTLSSGTTIITNSASSATGTGSLTVGPSATLGGTGISAGTGYSIAGTGTATGSRATVLVGMTSSTDTNTLSTLTLTGSGASVIQNANLAFNIKAQTAGGLGGTSNGGAAGGLGVSGSGTELSVGNTKITFGSGVGSVVLTLNVQNEPGIIGQNTAYVLMAGTLVSGGGGLNGSQYAGISGTTTTLNANESETIITGNNLQVAFGSTLDQSFYNGSYVVLYQNTLTGTDDIDVIVVPEPGTWAMMLGGLAVLVFWQRRKSKA